MAGMQIGDHRNKGIDEHTQNAFLGSAQRVAKLTAGAPLPFGPCKALLVGTAGTATLKDYMGNSCVNIPLQAGYNPICVSSLDALGTAADVWGLW